MTIRLLSGVLAVGAVLAASGCGGNNPCGVAGEPEPNDQRDTAAALTLGSSLSACVAAAGEEDWYQFTAPAQDAAGGYVQLAFTDVGAGTLGATTYTVSDNGEVRLAYAANDGANLATYVAVASGQQYRVKVTNQFAMSGPFRYTLKATYTPVSDMLEPNDRKETAKPLGLGTPVDAYLFAGFKTAQTPDDDAHADWYAVTLAGGTALTATLSNVPTNLTGWVGLYDAGGQELVATYGANAGASVTLTRAAADVTAGTFYLVVKKAFVFEAGKEPAGEGATVPDHFTRAYRLLASQP